MKVERIRTTPFPQTAAERVKSYADGSNVESTDAVRFDLEHRDRKEQKSKDEEEEHADAEERAREAHQPLSKALEAHKPAINVLV